MSGHDMKKLIQFMLQRRYYANPLVHRVDINFIYIDEQTIYFAYDKSKVNNTHTHVKIISITNLEVKKKICKKKNVQNFLKSTITEYTHTHTYIHIHTYHKQI